jgi:hypothetical protein
MCIANFSQLIRVVSNSAICAIFIGDLRFSDCAIDNYWSDRVTYRNAIYIMI